MIAASVREDPGTQVALFELGLETTRTLILRAELIDWQAAHHRLAEMGCRALGSDDPGLDATVVVATVTGLMLQGLAADTARFEEDLLRPALERLFAAISGRRPAAV